jgi:hypothetical protein
MKGDAEMGMKMFGVAALAAVLTAFEAYGFTVDAGLPAGNVVVDGISGDTVKVHQDLRDSGLWFYWAFRVKGAAGRTLTFVFTDKRWGGPVGVRGPVVSTDGGKTFSYPLDGKCAMDKFTYTFAAGENDVLFYECHPYVRANWDAFVKRHADALGRSFAVETLCKSRKGADVPCARFGCIGGEPKFRIFMSARHHCSETMASWVLEGIGEAFLADDDLGRWLRANVELMMVPGDLVILGGIPAMVFLTVLGPVITACMFYASVFAPLCGSGKRFGAYVAMAVILAIPRIITSFAVWGGWKELPLYLTQLPIHLLACWTYQKTDTVWTPIFTLAIANLLSCILLFGLQFVGIIA